METELQRIQQELETSKNNHSTASKGLTEAQQQIAHLENEVRDREKIMDEADQEH